MRVKETYSCMVLNKTNYTVTLNKEEQRLARYLARQRYETSRKNGVYDAKKGDQSNEFVDLEGISGELAFCKIFNVYPDIDSKLVNQTNDVGDCVYKGYNVDVKTTAHRNGRLICAKWKNNKVDIYALMVGEFPTYEFRGFAMADYLKKEENLTNLGNPAKGEVYALQQNQLKFPTTE
jgi:hypothetical protein